MKFRSKFGKIYRIPRRVYIKEKGDNGKMKFKGILEIAAKCVPLFTVGAYCVGFLIFALYSIKIDSAGKINFFTHLEAIDHLTMFGMGAVLLFIVFTPFISPSLIIYESLKENKAYGSTEQSLWNLDVIKTGYKKYQFWIALLICFPLGPLFIFLILLIISSFYPQVLSIPPLKYGVYFIILMGWIVLFLINLHLALNYQRNKNILWEFPLIVFLLIIVLSPGTIVNLAGYGNYWACLTITPSEGQSLIMNPEFKDLVRCSNDGFWYTPEQVFIPLQLRHHIFIAKMTKDNTKVEAIEMVSKKKAHIFHVTIAPISKSCEISEEKTT